MILIDAHTHIYGCYNLDKAVLCAFNNIEQSSKRTEEPIDAGVLFLTESTQHDYFGAFAQQAGKTHNEFSADRSWTVRKTDEPSSLLLAHTHYPELKLFIIAGRQLITEENLEVLAVDYKSSSPPKAPLHQTVTSIIDGDGIAVLPWGVGKWVGRRGTVLQRFLQENHSPLLFLGDNGSRPAFWPSSLLHDARQKKRKILSGSDPLPIAGEEKRICSFGTVVHTKIDMKRPAASVKISLSEPTTKLSQFGVLQPFFSFFKQQISIRLSS